MSEQNRAKNERYQARYCEEMVECLSRGHTLTAFAGEAGIPRTTLTVWARTHSDFGEALKVGQAKAVAFWERTLADIARTGKGNATAATFALKNCLADENAQAPGMDAVGTGIAYTWSDLELARRVSHILMLADRHDKGEDNDPALS